MSSFDSALIAAIVAAVIGGAVGAWVSRHFARREVASLANRAARAERLTALQSARTILNDDLATFLKPENPFAAWQDRAADRDSQLRRLCASVLAPADEVAAIHEVARILGVVVKWGDFSEAQRALLAVNLRADIDAADAKLVRLSNRLSRKLHIPTESTAKTPS